MRRVALASARALTRASPRARPLALRRPSALRLPSALRRPSARSPHRCANFGTCAAAGTGSVGTSAVNTELFELFEAGRDRLQQGKCSSVRPLVDEIVSLMTVPLVQGSLRYAYKVGTPAGRSAKNAAEGATFSAAVLPMVHNCNTASAAVVSANLKFGAATFDAVS